MILQKISFIAILNILNEFLKQGVDNQCQIIYVAKLLVNNQCSSNNFYFRVTKTKQFAKFITIDIPFQNILQIL